MYVGRITRQKLSYREINGAVIVNMRKCSNTSICVSKGSVEVRYTLLIGGYTRRCSIASIVVLRPPHAFAGT